MKRKNSLGVFSGLALGLASLYALKIYFDVSWAALKGLMFSTALLLIAMFVLAAVLVGIIKIVGKILHKSDDISYGPDDDQE
jgi:hypothetical protein